MVLCKHKFLALLRLKIQQSQQDLSIWSRFGKKSNRATESNREILLCKNFSGKEVTKHAKFSILFKKRQETLRGPDFLCRAGSAESEVTKK